jgi:spermidine synthase
VRAYEELERADTPFGEVVLSRRRLPGAGDRAAYEVKLAGALLMSSLVTDSERALATLALEPRGGAPTRGSPPGGTEGGRRVLVGGLGLGYTAVAALDQPGVTAVEVMDLLPQVIGWHRRGLVPLGARLTQDPRCRLVEGDVFARLLAPPAGLPFDAVLLDVDHTPDALLRPEHGAFYGEEGLRRASRHLAPGGVLAIWSALAPDPRFTARLARVFAAAHAHAVSFWNANNDAEETNTVYVAARG